MLEVGWKALGYDQCNLSRAKRKWHWGQVSFKRICGRSIVTVVDEAVPEDCANWDDN